MSAIYFQGPVMAAPQFRPNTADYSGSVTSPSNDLLPAPQRQRARGELVLATESVERLDPPVDSLTSGYRADSSSSSSLEPSQQPASTFQNNEGKKKPKSSQQKSGQGESKPRLNKQQQSFLETKFLEENKPSSMTKRLFAAHVKLNVDKVNNWFQNRRAKEKQERRRMEEASQPLAQLGHAFYPSPDSAYVDASFYDHAPLPETAINSNAHQSTISPDQAASWTQPHLLNIGQGSLVSSQSYQQQQYQQTHGLSHYVFPQANFHPTNPEPASSGVQEELSSLDSRPRTTSFVAHPRTMWRQQECHNSGATLPANDFTTSLPLTNDANFSAPPLTPNTSHECAYPVVSFMNASPSPATQADLSQPQALAGSLELSSNCHSQNHLASDNGDHSSQIQASVQLQQETPMQPVNYAANPAVGNGYSADFLFHDGQRLDNTGGSEDSNASLPLLQPQHLDTNESIPDLQPAVIEQMSPESSVDPVVPHSQAFQQSLSSGSTTPVSCRDAPLRKDSTMSMLAESLEGVEVYPQPPNTFPVSQQPIKPSNLAARRQARRPAALGAGSLRSTSFHAPAPHSPKTPNQAFAPEHSLRRIKSSMSVSRVQKSGASSAQRSPMALAFDESIKSPGRGRRRPSIQALGVSTSGNSTDVTVSGESGPMTPLSPLETSTYPPSLNQTKPIHDASTLLQEHASIDNEATDSFGSFIWTNVQQDFEHSHPYDWSSMPPTSGTGPSFASPPSTPQDGASLMMPPNYHNTQPPEGSNLVPHSAPAWQQTFHPGISSPEYGHLAAVHPGQPHENQDHESASWEQIQWEEGGAKPTLQRQRTFTDTMVPTGLNTLYHQPHPFILNSLAQHQPNFNFDMSIPPPPPPPLPPAAAAAPTAANVATAAPSRPPTSVEHSQSRPQPYHFVHNTVNGGPPRFDMSGPIPLEFSPGHTSIPYTFNGKPTHELMIQEYRPPGSADGSVPVTRPKIGPPQQKVYSFNNTGPEAYKASP